MVENIKLFGSVALLVAGVWGYYLLNDSNLLLRVGAVVGGVAAACALAAFSAMGRRFIGFSRESVNEVKKVVWPTRKETMQTTAAVFAFAVAMAVFLWMSDKGLEWVLYDVILGWKKT